MGKESLIKSTSKKAAPKKAKTAKKTTSKSGSGAKATSKASSKAKTAKSGKTAAAPTSKPSKAPTLKDLLFKKFADYPTPKGAAAASPDFSNMTAPPLIDTNDPAKADRLRSLLSLKFSMAEIKAVAKPPEEAKPAAAPPKAEAPTPAAPAPEAPKAEPPTLAELLFKKFTDHPTPKGAAAASPDFSNMTAPPLIDTDDPAKADHLRSLLSLKFSMAEIKAVAKPPEEAKPAAAPPKAEEPKPAAPAPEPPKAEPPTLAELLFKKFTDHPTPKGAAAASPDFSNMTAPPLIDTDDPAKADRLRSLLSLKFSMAEIKAVAKPPEEAKPAAAPPKAEEPKPAAPAPEPPKAEEPKPAAPAPEPPKAEEPKPVAPAPEPPKAEEPKPVAPAPEPPKVEEPKPAAVPHTPQPPAASVAPQKEPAARVTDPVLRSAVIALSVIAALFLIILWASFNNSTKYFIVPKKGSIEIWRGEFSPTGQEFFVVLHGVEPEAPIQEEYSRQEVYPLIFNYYLEKSDALLEVSELPDYKSIIDYLEKAECFALDGQMREAVAKRLNNIQRLTLLYKADVDAGKGTVESLAAAIDSLKQTQRLTKDPAQAEVINQKIQSLMERKEAMEKEVEAATPEAAPQESPEHQE